MTTVIWQDGSFYSDTCMTTSNLDGEIIGQSETEKIFQVGGSLYAESGNANILQEFLFVRKMLIRVMLPLSSFLVCHSSLLLYDNFGWKGLLLHGPYILFGLVWPFFFARFLGSWKEGTVMKWNGRYLTIWKATPKKRFKFKNWTPNVFICTHRFFLPGGYVSIGSGNEFFDEEMLEELGPEGTIKNVSEVDFYTNAKVLSKHLDFKRRWYDRILLRFFRLTGVMCNVR